MKILKSKIFTLSAIIICSIFIIGFCQYSLYKIEQTKTKLPFEQRIESITKIQKIERLREKARLIIESEEARMELEIANAELHRVLGISILFFSLLLLFELYSGSKDSNNAVKRDK